MNSSEARCGILTYHFAVNYGAVLQCYALRSSLNANGIRSEVINYVSNKQNNNNSLYRKGYGIKGLVKNVILLPFHVTRSRRRKRFREFVNDRILDNETNIITSLEELKDFVENQYEYVISGSDQVFNPNINDFNMAFFFPFKTSVTKIAYAASTGGATLQELMAFKEYIDDFDTITSRENTTTDVLKKITTKRINEVCDPVFLLTKNEWKQIVSDVKAQKYLLCYFVKTTDIKRKMETAEKIAKENGLQVLLLSARISKYNFSCRVVSDAGPIEFVSFLANADYICTDSFHGTSFSLIFNKPFSTFERREDAADGRKTNILQSVNALERIYYLGDEWHKPKEIDYAEVNQKLMVMKRESLQILLDAIQ